MLRAEQHTAPRRRDPDPLDRLLLEAAAAPESAAALERLGRGLLASGRRAEAIQVLFEAVQKRDSTATTLHLLGEVLHVTVLGGATGIEPAAVLKALRHPAVDRQLFAGQALEVLKEHLVAPLAAGRAGDWDEAARLILAQPPTGVVAELMTSVLEECIVTDLEAERLFTALRRRLLFAEGLGRAARRLACALACQGRINRWVWDEEPAEAARLAQLQAVAGDEATWLRWALYRPIEHLAALRPPPRLREPQMRAMLEEVAAARRREAEIARAIPVLGQATDPISAAVQAQYEVDPSPRWLSLTRFPATKADRNRDEEILIAGCGTGKQAIEARLRYADPKRVTAIDLSRASLCYAARMAADAYGLRDIRFAQCDLRDVALLETRFDIIECVGVLHHMADAAAGLRALRQVLRPDGRMLIGLYSRRAREAIALARERIAAAGITGRTLDDVRRVRRLVKADAGSPWARMVLSAWDFYSAPDVRDLMLHAHEREFDLDEIVPLLASADLAFAGLNLTAYQRALFASHAPGREIEDLRAWAEVEATEPRTFQNMYLFWCRPLS